MTSSTAILDLRPPGYDRFLSLNAVLAAPKLPLDVLQHVQRQADDATFLTLRQVCRGLRGVPTKDLRERLQALRNGHCPPSLLKRGFPALSIEVARQNALLETTSRGGDLPGPGGLVIAASVSNCDRYLFVIDEEVRCIVYDLARSPPAAIHRMQHGHYFIDDDMPDDCQISEGGQSAVMNFGSEGDEHVVYWDLSVTPEKSVCLPGSGPVRLVNFVDAHTVIQHRGGALSLIELHNGAVKKTINIRPPRTLISAVAYSELAGTCIIGCEAGDVFLAQLREGCGITNFKKLESRQTPVIGVAISKDGKRAVTVANDGTSLWDLTQCPASSVSLLLHAAARCERAVFSHDGLALATVTSEGVCEVWDLGGGVPVRKLLIDDLYGVVFSPDGGVLISASHTQGIELWNWKTGTPASVAVAQGTKHNVLLFGEGRFLCIAPTDEIDVQIRDLNFGGPHRVRPSS